MKKANLTKIKGKRKKNRGKTNSISQALLDGNSIKRQTNGPRACDVGNEKQKEASGDNEGVYYIPSSNKNVAPQKATKSQR